MVSLVSKRQQAKSERELQQLIADVPGNDRCADCEAPNPGWASWSLGIFLCMRCAGLHRKMGTHITKVKSLSMDSWTSDQVRNMKRVGNVNSNHIYNPDNVKPEIPLDMDMVDGVMERFIRQKYEIQVLKLSPKITKARLASLPRDEGSPPPLPPKPSRGIGFKLRSASSVVTRFGKITPPVSPVTDDSDLHSLPPRGNKKSRVLGSNIGNREDDFDAKLATLRDMGFRDNRRNSAILKSMNGDLARTIEALVQAAEADKPPSGTLTPVSAASGGLAPPSGGIGLSVAKTRTPESRTTNPFDALDFEPLPQRSATMPVPRSGPVTNSFETQSHYQPPQTLDQSLERGFSGLNVSQPSSSTPTQASVNTNPFLAGPMSGTSYAPSPHQQFGHYTQVGPQPTGYAGAQTQDPWSQPQQNLHIDTSQAWPQQQSNFGQAQPMQSPQGFTSHQNNGNTYFQPSQQYQVQSAQSQNSAYGMGGSAYGSSNPFLQQSAMSPQSTTNPFLSQQQQQQQPSYQQSTPFQHQPQQQFPSHQQSTATQPPQQQQFPSQQFPSQGPMPGPSPYTNQAQQSPFRHDKTSILALYNQPAQSQPQQPFGVPQRSVTMPAASSAGNMNPFATATNTNGVEQAYQAPVSATDPFGVHRWT